MNCDKKGLGIWSQKKNKRDANLLLKRYMESGWLKLVDERTLYELSRYEEIRPNVFGAGRKDHDDCVTSLLWALYYLLTSFYEGREEEGGEIEDQFRIDDDGSDDDGPLMFID